MTPVDQLIIDHGRGDCMRAAVASLFDLEIEQVPHFILFDREKWWWVYYYFVLSLGWEHIGYGNIKRGDLLRRYHSVDGYFLASVYSKTFTDGTTHSVIIDMTGRVVHDPNPNKRWQGKHAFQADKIFDWAFLRRRSDNNPPHHAPTAQVG